VGASCSYRAPGGGIWPDGAGRPDPAASTPPTKPAPEPATAGEVPAWGRLRCSVACPCGLLACHGVHRLRIQGQGRPPARQPRSAVIAGAGIPTVARRASLAEPRRHRLAYNAIPSAYAHHRATVDAADGVATAARWCVGRCRAAIAGPPRPPSTGRCQRARTRWSPTPPPTAPPAASRLRPGPASSQGRSAQTEATLGRSEPSRAAMTVSAASALAG
jgi:hypothetical protein